MNNNTLVFSGVQPTGNIHLGNYLGALKNFVLLQKEMKCIYCVVDMHAITVRQDPKILKNNILEVAAAFVASGINPEKSTNIAAAQIASIADILAIIPFKAKKVPARLPPVLRESKSTTSASMEAGRNCSPPKQKPLRRNNIWN